MKRIALLACCLPLAGHAEETPIRLSPAQIKSLSIAVQPLKSFEASGARQLPAQVVVPPRQAEVLAAPVAGTIASVSAAYGETVRQGQVLARLKGPQGLELQRDFVQAQVQAQVAGENRRRDEALFADGIIAGSRLSASRAAERQASAMYAEKRQAMRLAGLAEPGRDASFSGTAEVRAPFDGVVLEAAAQAGQRVDATAALFKLARISPLWLEIQATPQQASGFAPGDAVLVPGCASPGRLTLVAPHMNPSTQSLLLRAELPKPDGCVKPFQFVQARLTPARGGVGQRVPAAALTRHREQTWLFSETAAGFRPVAVKVIEDGEKSALVTVDLPVEARIVVSGVAALKAQWLGLGAGEGK